MNKTGINWSGFNVKSAFPAATDEKWVKGEPVEISQPVQITVRPQSSDISRIWWMRKKKKQVSLARSQLGESLLVSESVQSGSHSSTGLLTLIISVGFVQILQCSSDYCPCAWAKKKKGKKGKPGGNGKRQAIFICELCTDIHHCFEDTCLLPLPTFSCKTNSWTSLKNEQPFP